MNIVSPSRRWHEKAANLAIEGRLFIDGEFRNAVSGARFETINPADDSVTREQQKRVLDYIDIGKRGGATCMLGGGVPDGLEHGGWKESGNGRDKCMDAIVSYTQSKGVWVTIGN